MKSYAYMYILKVKTTKPMGFLLFTQVPGFSIISSMSPGFIDYKNAQIAYIIDFKMNDESIISHIIALCVGQPKTLGEITKVCVIKKISGGYFQVFSLNLSWLAYVRLQY